MVECFGFLECLITGLPVQTKKKEAPTNIGTLRISHTSLKLHWDIPYGSFTESDLREIGAITDKVW